MTTAKSGERSDQTGTCGLDAGCIGTSWERPVKSVLLAAIGFLVLHRLALALLRDFDPDELQHMHAGFSMAGGLTPYIDYFEHHAPWFPLGLSYLISGLGASWNTLLAARVLMWAVSIATMVGTGALVLQSTRRLMGDARAREAALAAVLIHATVVSNIDKAVEIRPDVPAALCLVLALVLYLAALRNPGPSTLKRALMGGFILGCGLMLTPKLAFAAIGIGVGSIVAAVASPSHAKGALKVLSAFTASSLVPAALTALVVWRQGHLDEFVRDVVIGPLGWEREVEPWVHMSAAIRRSPLHLAVGVIGLIYLVATLLQKRGRDTDPAQFVVPAAAVAIMVGWWTVPVPWPQFLLPLWPLLAFGAVSVLAAVRGAPAALALGAATALLVAGAIATTDLTVKWAVQAFLPALWITGASLAWIAAARTPSRARIVLGAAGLAVLGLGALRTQPHVVTYGALWLFLAALPAIAPSGQRLFYLALAAITAIPLVPIGRLIERRPLDGFRAEFEWIMNNTEPSESVLTGWRGCATFRPHAYYYAFLHPGMLQMLTDAQRGPNVLQALEANWPAAVVRDAATRGLGPEVQAALDERYEPAGVGEIWRRKP